MLQSPVERRALLWRGVRFAAALAVASTAVNAALAQPANPAQGGAPLKIGIVGSGRIGSTIGTLMIKAGHPVLFSSRKPEELTGLVDSLGPLAKAGAVPDAISFGDVIILAVPYGAMPQLGHDYASSMAGKVVIDATNFNVARDGEPALAAQRNGIGETTARYFPGVRLIRGFNSLNYVKLTAAVHSDPLTALPLAGDDKGALDVASGLVRDAGFEPVVVGPLSRAKDFSDGAPVFLQVLTAQELRQKLQISP